MTMFGTKNALFGYILGQNFKNTIVIFEISTLKFVKTDSLTRTVNFGIGSAFSEGPGPGPGPGPLYKVCHANGLFQYIIKFKGFGFY